MKDSQWIPELQHKCREDVQMRFYKMEITYLRNQLLDTMSPHQKRIFQTYESNLTDFSRLLAKTSCEIGLEKGQKNM